MGWRRFLTKNSLLILILVFGFCLFVYRLGEIPNGLYVDEAVVGYDAYSIINTFKDHWGKLLPIYFKFFGSYTPGLFVYFQIIPITLFGLEIFSVRIWSVLSMLIVAWAIYFFWKENKEYKYRYLPFLSVFLFLITPWVVFNARVGYETTFAFMLMSLGIAFYKKPFLSFVLLSLSTYASHGQRYLAPLIIFLICFVFYLGKEKIKQIIKPMLAALIIQIPNLIMLFSPSFWVKKDSFNSNFLSQYLSYFLPSNLFNGQDFDLQRSIPEISVFYSWMFIPWLIGFYCIYKNWRKPFYKYLLGLVLISPIPAAIANTNYSTQRALMLLLPYSLLISLGVDKILNKFKSKFIFLSLGLVVFCSLIFLWRSYFVLMPAERAEAWNFGYKDLVVFISSNKDKKIIVDNSRGVPYIEFLFFMKYSPGKFHKENPLIGSYYKDVNFSGNISMGNIEFRPIDWKNDIYEENILVGDNLSISTDQAEEHFLTRLFEITDRYGKILFECYKTNPDLKNSHDFDDLENKSNNKVGIIKTL